MAKTFLVSDESVNRYGFRILTEGIQLGNFKKNPVMFFNHRRGNSWNPDPSYKGPVGRWEKLQKAKEGLQADPVFDLNDEIGKTLSDKVENDFIRATSLGIEIIETSNDPELMIKGQTGPTVTKCELIEISVVDIPANKNAVALFDSEGNIIEMKDNVISHCLSSALKNPPLPEPKQDNNKNSNTMKTKILAAWSAVLAFLSLKVEEGKDHIEVELTAEKLAELNTKLTQLSACEKQIGELHTKLTAADAKVTELTTAGTTKDTKITELEAKVAELGKPADQIKHPIKKDDDKELNQDKEKETQVLSGEVQELHDIFAFSFETTKLSDNPSFVEAAPAK